MVGKPRAKPIPREEPDAPVRDEPTTLRPPRGEEGEDEVSTYAKLRDSCRVAASAPAHEEASADEELAIEAEIVRVALERGTQRPKA